MPQHPISRRPDGRIMVNCYDVPERRQILAAAQHIMVSEEQNFPFACIAGLLLYTGMRWDELQQVRWNAPANETESWPWLDFTCWQIVIPSSAKRKRGERYVPIIPQVGRLLMEWPGAKHGELFPFDVTPVLIEQRWDETIQLAQVKFIAWHELRDTYITLMLEAGLSLKEIMEILPATKADLQGALLKS